MTASFHQSRPPPPAGFIEQRSHRQIWWVKAGWEGALQEALAQTAAGIILPVASGGRGAVHRVALGEWGTAIVRHYHRGGLMRHFMRDLYWDRPPRPFAELIRTEAIRQRGVPTVEVWGAAVEWITIGLYRGTFVTCEAEGFINLWEWLRTKPTGTARETVVAAVAHAIAHMHDAGVTHADLNLTNILVQAAVEAPHVLPIDFDQARLLSGPLPSHRRLRNLHRLRRSLDKLDPGGQLFSPTDLKLFCQVYHRSGTAVHV